MKFNERLKALREKKRYDAGAACEGVRRFRPDDTKI